MPGVGASIGLDRLHAALEELKRLGGQGGSTDVLVLCLDEALIKVYHRLAATLREAGLSAEVYPEKVKLTRQFQFAERKGIRVGIICGEDEMASGGFVVRDLAARKSQEGVPEQELAAAVRRVLSTEPRR